MSSDLREKIFVEDGKLVHRLLPDQSAIACELYALLFGRAFYFLIGNPQVKPGIDFCDCTGLVLGARVLPSRSDASAVLASIPFDVSLEPPRN